LSSGPPGFVAASCNKLCILFSTYPVIWCSICVVLRVPFTKAKKRQYSFQSRFNAVINELTTDVCDRGFEKLLVQFKKFPACCATRSFICMLVIAHILSMLCSGNLLCRTCAQFPHTHHVYNDWLYSLFTWTRIKRVFERRVVRKIFGPIKSQDGSWRIGTNYEICLLMKQHRE
jgi:hypothetical protein